MKNITFLFLALFSCVFANAGEAPKEGPLFDKQGHQTAYQYADGSRDLNVYDSQWRLIKFTSRVGKHTLFAYKSDGTMQTVPAH